MPTIQANSIQQLNDASPTTYTGGRSIDLAKIAVHLRVRREKEEAKEREAERQRQEAEIRRQLRLKSLFSQWLKAKQMCEFLSLAQKMAIKPETLDMSQEEWLA